MQHDSLRPVYAELTILNLRRYILISCDAELMVSFCTLMSGNSFDGPTFFGPWNGSPSATNVVLVGGVVVITFAIC